MNTETEKNCQGKEFMLKENLHLPCPIVIRDFNVQWKAVYVPSAAMDFFIIVFFFFRAVRK